METQFRDLIIRRTNVSAYNLPRERYVQARIPCCDQRDIFSDINIHIKNYFYNLFHKRSESKKKERDSLIEKEF